jgi:hypothetical protein
MIDVPRLLFGRMVEEPRKASISSKGVASITDERVKVIRKDGTIEVQVYDPFNWISRKHFEIYERGNKWYFKDLGSLNRSAILTKGSIKEAWAGRMRESPAQELGERAMIYLAYGSSLKNPPYLVATFKT